MASWPVRTARWLAPRVALTVGALLLLLPVAELITRASGEVTPPLKLNDPTVGATYLPGFDGDVYVSEAGRELRLRFNELGFRGASLTEAKPPGVRRVALMGDSMVAALAVNEEDTTAVRLEGLLNHEASREAWQVMNLGIEAASPGQALVLYRERVVRYAPDVVLYAFFVGNDLGDSSRALDSHPRIYFEPDGAGGLRQLPFSTSRARINAWLNRHSRFYVWQKNATNRAGHRAQRSMGKMPAGHWIFHTGSRPEVERAWTIVERVLTTFRDEVEARGARFAVVVLPLGQQVYREGFTKLRARAGEHGPMLDPELPERRLAELAGRTGVTLVSLTPGFVEATGGLEASETPEEALLFFKGTGHFAEAGNALAAREIHRLLFADGVESTPEP